MKEIWRDIKGYEGLYQVSNLGRVKSLSRYADNGRCIRKTSERILKGIKDKNGYLRVHLSNKGIIEKWGIHRLVGLAFINNINKLPIINHKDENPSNNHMDNLEWCDYKYNNNYGTRNKRVSENKKGSKHPRARKIICITTGEVFNCMKQAEEIYNVHHSNITKCCLGEYKASGIHPVTKERLQWKFYEDYLALKNIGGKTKCALDL